MPTGKSDLIDIFGTLKFETPKAYLFDFGHDEGTWVPKSQVEIDEKGGGFTVTMPTWLAKEKGLI